MDKRIQNFVWGTTEEERKICLVARDKVCLPKEKGGLGLKLARELNRAYLTKLAFTFFKEKDKLWVRVLQHKYFRQTEIVLESQNLRSSSSLWKGMSREWGTMMEGAKSAIMDGNDTLFWTNNWVDSGLCLLYFAKTDDPDFDVHSSVASMVNNEGQWDFPRLEKLLPPEVVDVVAGMSPPQTDRGDDDWVWGLEKSGVFSIKSAYNLICHSTAIPGSDLWKAVWKWEGPNRIKHFLWLATKDKLLTNEGRRQRGLSSDAACKWCRTAAETIVHVLRDCDFTNSTWLAVGGFDLDETDWNLPVESWLKKFLTGSRALRFGIVCWLLWRARNERLFAASVEGANSIAAKCLGWEEKVGAELRGKLFGAGEEAEADPSLLADGSTGLDQREL
ncbi:Putative ribonuclease H protein At1g65750 [Linum perenne]